MVLLFIYVPALFFFLQYFTEPADDRNQQVAHSDRSRDAGSRKDSTYLACRFNLCTYMHCSLEHHNPKFGLQKLCTCNNTASRCF